MADVSRKPARKYDAVLAPAGYPKGKTGAFRNEALRAEFSKDFGSPRVFWTHVGPEQILITPEPCSHRYQPDTHPEAGQDRYDWVDRGDGVLVGFLTDAAKVTDEDRAEAERQAAQGTLTERQKQVQARTEALETIPEAERTDAEKAELAKLKKFAAAMFGGDEAVVKVAQASTATTPASPGKLK